MIAEPTLEYYLYYLRRLAGDSSQAVRKHRAACEADLHTLLSHLERLSGQAIPFWKWPEEKEERHVSQRIMRTGWLRNPSTGRACFVEVRTYGDLYWLQVGYDQRGQVGPDVFSDMHAEAWQPSAGDHLLGQSIYLCGIVPEGGDELASQALAAYLGYDPGPLVSTGLASGRAELYGTSRQPYLGALFYPDTESERWSGRVYLNHIAPRLELYRHKVDRQLAWCEQNFPVLSKQDGLLRRLLDESGRAPSAGLSLLQQLARLYRVFDSNVGMLTDRQTTIEINLSNLEIVLRELEPLGEDHFLSAVCADLHRRRTQLDADLVYADQARQRAERSIGAITAELRLDRLMKPRPRAGGAVPEGLIERGGFPGVLPMVEGDIIPPRIDVQHPIQLTAQESTLIQQIFLGYKRVQVEKEFGGGYSGTRVFLTLPITASDRKAALTVTKLGSAGDIRTERSNYEQYVEPYLSFCVAPLKGERYYEQDEYAVLNCAYVGEGALGQAMDLETCYRLAVPSRNVIPLIETIYALLNEELGQHWYGQAVPAQLSFAAEYGRHLVEHLRLRLRPGSVDQFWPLDQPPAANLAYRSILAETIPDVYVAVEPGESVCIEGLVVRRVKQGLIKLGYADNRGIVIRVEFDPDSDTARTLQPGDRVGVRGVAIYNRRERLEQIACAAFPDLAPAIHDDNIGLTGLPRIYPNPLKLYSPLLSRTLEDSHQSYVHGDLHLRNVLVDEGGRGWLIDFARVEERHNLFDFIKLETYVRLMALADGAPAFSLGEYIRFEEALVAATLSTLSGGIPHKLMVTIQNGIWRRAANPRLVTAHDLILAVRRMAHHYMIPSDSFSTVYFPALFLYCLAMMKYYQDNNAESTRLVFATATVLGKYFT